MPPLPDLSGRTLVPHGGKLFALYPWVEGAHCPGPRMSPAQCRELGALLARFHSALSGILGPVEQPVFEATPSPEEAEAHAHRLLELCRTRPLREGIDELAEFRLLERIGLIRTHVARRPPDTRVLTVGHVHGDFHGLNVLHGPEGDVRAVVDWDRLSVRPYGEELVRSALIIYVDRNDGTLDLDRAREYVGGYLDQRPWMAAEMETAVHRLWWERLTDFWMLVWRYELGDPRTDVQFPGASALVVWWTHHYDKVLDAFTCAEFGRLPAPRTPSDLGLPAQR